ncbi:hypothetical protein [Candidatus Amarolinea dominans]|uniref:hypothetical protein n=1 Tax=Candidatus Amarolinea dominans TaxID=3140696 RepID=UPI001D2ED7C0|nr:hypothetical protein [Anaerolineae bacterium]
MGAPATAVAAAKFAEQIVVLSQSDFAVAVRDALRDFVRPGRVARNPLMRSRLVLDAVRHAAPADRAVALQALIKEAADAPQASPRIQTPPGAASHPFSTRADPGTRGRIAGFTLQHLIAAT